MSIPAEPIVIDNVFAIDCDEHANWYLRKKIAFEAQRNVLRAQYQKMLAAIDSDEKSFTEHFDPQFEAFSKEKIAGNKKGKFHDFLFGRVALRTVPGRWNIADPVAALAAAKEVCPAAVEIVTTEKLDKAALINYAEQTGEVIPGVERVQDRDSFSIKFKAEEGEA